MLLLAAFALAGCGKAAKERFPAAGAPAVLFEPPPKGWTRTMTSKKGYSMLAIYSPDMSCGLTLGFVEDGPVAITSYRKMEQDFAAKSSMLKTEGMNAVKKSGFDGVAFDTQGEKGGGEVTGRVYCYRLDATHAVIIEGFKSTGALPEERDVVGRFLESVEFVPGPGGAAAQPTPDERALEAIEDAQAALDKKDCDGAIAACDEVLKVSPHNAEAYLLLGIAHSIKHDYKNALPELDEAVRRAPGRGIARYRRGIVREILKDYAGASADFAEAIKLEPGKAQAWGEMAWLLATCPDTAMRDGKKAVEDATKACELSQWQRLKEVDTLAAAYAESGDFADAVKFEQWCLTFPGMTDDEAKRGRERLAGYQAGKAWRDE